MPSATPPPWSHAFAELPTGVTLHFVEAGERGRPLVLLLHGFPEFWYGWRHQIGPLAAAGFHVVAPDLRGYNLSSKPPRVSDYRVEHVAADVLGLAAYLGRRRFSAVGHDWGGIVAWWIATHAENRLQRLAILNAPHPSAYLGQLWRPGQLLRSWYAFFFQLPWLSEAGIRARNFRAIRRLFRDEPMRCGAFTDDDIEQYVTALSQPGALTAAINYYRAAARRVPIGAARRIRTPTMLIWGTRDRYMLPATMRASEDWTPDSTINIWFSNATHWVQHDEPEQVNDHLIPFLA